MVHPIKEYQDVNPFSHARSSRIPQKLCFTVKKLSGSETGGGKWLILTGGSVFRALIWRPFAFVESENGIQEGGTTKFSEMLAWNV